MARISKDLLELLQCPNSKTELTIFNQTLKASDGSQEYPLLEGIPWLFKNQDYFKVYWSAKKAEFINFHKGSAHRLNEELKNPTLNALTRDRLLQLKTAHEWNQKKLSDILKPLDSTETMPYEVGVPSHQSLHLYRKNLFRDWGWDTDENKIAVELVRNLMGADFHPDRFCILGSGASRLAMDLHFEYKLPLSVAVDFNPLLLLVAQLMNQGKSLALYDFATAPVDIESVARCYNLVSRLPPLSGFHFVFGDVTDLPFKTSSFNAVLTPWLIDILPMSFKMLAQRINRVLEVGGDWFNFGPLGFSHRHEADNLTLDEVNEQLNECGFEIEIKNKTKIKYLSATDEVNSRNETVVLYKAKKIKDVAVEPFDYWSSWLRDANLAIPLTEDIVKHQQLVRFQADLFHSVDGQVSVNQIAELFSRHYKIPVDAALKMATNVLRQFDESLKRK